MKKRILSIIAITFLSLGNAQVYTPNGSVGITTNPASGNIGIGTNNPSSSLDINADGGIPIIRGHGDYISSGLRFIDDSYNSEGQIKEWSIWKGNEWIKGLGFMRYDAVKTCLQGGCDTPFALMDDGSISLGLYNNVVNVPAKLSVTNDVNITGAINTNHISTGSFVINNGYNHSTMRIGKDGHDNIIADNSPEKYYGGGYFFRVTAPDNINYHDVMILSENGNIGIGINNPQNKLDVNGTIHAKEVKVDLNGWADYVFKTDYKLPSLEDVERHIKEKGHLPSIPSEQEVLKNGINLGDNQRLLLQKIEELTLYSIEQNKQLKMQNEEINNLKLELKALKNKK